MQLFKKENYYPNQIIDSHYQVDDRYNFKQLVLGHKEQMITLSIQKLTTVLKKCLQMLSIMMKGIDIFFS